MTTAANARRHTMGTEEINLPKLAAPARRALEGAGYTRLEDLTKVTESEVMKLHGMGANAMQVLRNALKECGLSFRDG
jgi:DNA-directed RNA polymerase alpha subunit